MKFNHIGIIVPSLARGREHLSPLLDMKRWTEAIEDPINKVYVQFGLDNSGVCYEIIAPLGENSPIARALKLGSRVLNHVAYTVADLEIAAETMRQNRCFPAGPAQVAIAFGGNRIQFFVSPLRFIIELIEAPDHHHHYEDRTWTD